MYIHLALGPRSTLYNVAEDWDLVFESQVFNLLSLAGFILSDVIALIKR